MATITIDEDLLKRIEEKAAKESRTAEQIANELLRSSLNGQKPYKLELEGWNAQLRPGVDLSDRNQMYELMDGDELAKKYGR